MTTELQVDDYDVRDFEVASLADELTLVNQTLLLRIRSDELCNFVFLSSDKVRS